MFKLLFCLPVFLLLTACSNNETTASPLPDSASTIAANPGFETIDFFCDTIYPNKNYKLSLVVFDTTEYVDSNCVFTFYQKRNEKYVSLFTDSVLSQYKKIEFADFNGDQIPDILVQCFSDVRSNWTYNLYIVDTAHNTLQKIKGFNEVKNPAYLPQYDLVETSGVSGKNWTAFSKIKGDSVKNYPFLVYDNLRDDGKYERDYNRILRKVLAAEKLEKAK